VWTVAGPRPPDPRMTLASACASTDIALVRLACNARMSTETRGSRADTRSARARPFGGSLELETPLCQVCGRLGSSAS